MNRLPYRNYLRGEFVNLYFPNKHLAFLCFQRHLMDHLESCSLAYFTAVGEFTGEKEVLPSTRRGVPPSSELQVGHEKSFVPQFFRERIQALEGATLHPLTHPKIIDIRVTSNCVY